MVLNGDTTFKLKVPHGGTHVKKKVLGRLRKMLESGKAGKGIDLPRLSCRAAMAVNGR
jgi:hypothetical protein